MRLLMVPESGHSAMRELVAAVLRRHGGGEVTCDLAEALELARITSYLGAVIECSARGQAARRLRPFRDAGHDFALIAVCDGGSAERTRILNLGADDVVAPGCAEEELNARLLAIMRRSRGFAHSRMRVGEATLDLNSRSLEVAGMALGLTPHEFTLLRLLFLRRGSVVDKGVLMEQLYPDGREPELKAVEVMVCRLRKKLQAAGAAWLIGTVWGTGYRLGEPPAPLPAALPAVPPLPVNAPAPFA